MAQRNLPLRQPRHLRIMCHHHNRVSIAMQILQQLRHNRLIRRIQIPRRLIRQQNRRIINQRPCNANPLLLPTRQLTRQMRNAIPNPTFSSAARASASSVIE